MANFYLDVSAIGNEYQAYADTPTTWGIPQDGNGKAGPGHTAAVAVATIDCAAASASGAGQLGVLGVTVSSTLTGSGATLAANIVTAINASATATGASYSALLLPLNKLVFARQNPTTNTTVDIMLRIAGTDWVGFTPVSAGTWGVAPTMTNFAGGADGPFAYYTNTVAVFGKAIHASYGLLTTNSPAVSEPANDAIHVRSMRSGISLSVTHTSSSGNIYFSLLLQRNFIVDHGDLWIGDDGVFSHVLLATGANVWAYYATLNTIANKVTIDGGKIGGMVVSFQTNQTNNSSMAIGPSTNDTKGFAAFKHITFTEVAATAASGSVVVDRWVTGSMLLFDACTFNYTANGQKIGCTANAGQASQALFSKCTFNWTGLGANASGFITSWSTINRINLRFIDCDFSVDGGTRSLVNPMASGASMTSAAGSVVSFENCRGITNPSAGLPVTAPTNPSQLMFLWDGSDAGRSYRIETNCFTNEWVDDGTFPTLTATNQATRPVCNRVSMRTLGITPVMPIQVSRYNTFYKAAAASKTLTINVLTESTKVPTYAHIHPVLKYTDSTDVVRFQSMGESWARQVGGISTVLPASAASWTLNGVTGYEARKIVFVTDYPVKTNSELTIELWLAGPPTSDTYLYINPEIEVS